MPRKGQKGYDSNWGLRQTTEHCPTPMYTAEQLEFMKAMEKYQKETGRKFPTCSEVLQVAISLGYRKVTENREQV
jgi:hypothetical protein